MAYFANGTDGEIYESTFCEKCVHYGECPVWEAQYDYAYDLCNKKESPGKKILDMLIPIRPDGFAAKCTMFYQMIA